MIYHFQVISRLSSILSFFIDPSVSSNRYDFGFGLMINVVERILGSVLSNKVNAALINHIQVFSSFGLGVGSMWASCLLLRVGWDQKYQYGVALRNDATKQGDALSNHITWVPENCDRLNVSLTSCLANWLCCLDDSGCMSTMARKQSTGFSYHNSTPSCVY
jgi:hypothetical protein